jgi:hypothetical protein
VVGAIGQLTDLERARWWRGDVAAWQGAQKSRLAQRSGGLAEARGRGLRRTARCRPRGTRASLGPPATPAHVELETSTLSSFHSERT